MTSLSDNFAYTQQMKSSEWRDNIATRMALLSKIEPILHANSATASGYAAHLGKQKHFLEQGVHKT